MQALEEMLLLSGAGPVSSLGPEETLNPKPRTQAPNSILDTSALEGLLDDQAFGSYQDARGSLNRSFMDSGVLGEPLAWPMG